MNEMDNDLVQAKEQRCHCNYKRLFVFIILLAFVFLIAISCPPGFIPTGPDPAVRSAEVKKAELKMDKPLLVMRSGTSRALKCNLKEQPADDLQWSTSDHGIARVDNKGIVTALAKGSAVITAVTRDGKASGTAFVIVDRDPLHPLTPIKPPRYQLQKGVYRNPEALESAHATLMLTGDLMCVIRQQRRAQLGSTYIFNPSFRYVRNIFSEADFVIGNLETMLSHTWPYKVEETRIDGQWNCNAPVTFLDALRYAGFDGLVTANNHSCDTGPQGIRETISHLDRCQFMHTGISADQEGLNYFLVSINGMKVAFLSYTCLLNTADHYFTEKEAQAMVNMYSPENVARDVAGAQAQGAEFIIAYVHWGRQNGTTVTEAQITCAQEIADAGVNYIIGSHPHVLQPYDVLKAGDGRRVPVVYSLGNFVASMDEVEGNRDAVILQLCLKRTALGVEAADQGYVPCYIVNELDGFSTVVVPISAGFDTNSNIPELDKTHQRIVKALGPEIKEIKR